jgi:uncharacterized protein YndB with AHSA1/START domain
MRVKTSIVILAPPDDVFRFITQPQHGPRWQESALSTRVMTPGPIGLGSEMVHEGKWLWMRLATTAVVTVYEPPRRYGYDIRSQLTPMPSLMRYALEPVDGGTRLTLSNEATLPALMKLFEPFLQRNVQGMFERDVARLKSVIEAGVAPRGSLQE